MEKCGKAELKQTKGVQTQTDKQWSVRRRKEKYLGEEFLLSHKAELHLRPHLQAHAHLHVYDTERVFLHFHRC